MSETDQSGVSETDETAETGTSGAPEAGEPVPAGAAAPRDAAAGREAQASAPAGERDAAQARGGGESANGARERSAEQDALEGDVDELLQALAKRDEYLALAQRTQADFENYRKRVAREAAKGEQRGVARLAKELLPALDNLDRAIDAAAEGDPLLEGVRLVRNELGAALSRLQIEHFSPVGERFDPSLHEAVAQQPVEGADSGSVAEVYQAGYKLGDHVIRPARVLVAA
ncbi:MAG: nucleotide exchange factor GrpE [Solirubrobacteraceae bacterium]